MPFSEFSVFFNYLSSSSITCHAVVFCSACFAFGDLFAVFSACLFCIRRFVRDFLRLPLPSETTLYVSASKVFCRGNRRCRRLGGLPPTLALKNGVSSCIMFNSFLHAQSKFIHLGTLGILLFLFIRGPVDDAGGKRGFDKVLWRVQRLKKGPRQSIQFTYHSRDGEQGFPGVLDVSATYTLSGPRELTLEIKAVPRTKATPVSLAQHTYWNLAGEASNRSILSNKVTIWAHSITPVDKHLIPTGAIVPVKGTSYDFTKPTAVGKRINYVSGGYDINYVLDRPKSKHRLRRAVRVKDDFSGRVLDLWTNNIGLQFYSSNQIKKIVGKGGAIYRKYAGLALETQAFPDAVDQPNFPSIIYRPGQIYRHVMVYKFSVEK